VAELLIGARGDVNKATTDGKGEAVQLAPMRPVLKAPGSMLLKLRYDGLPSKFAFNSNLRRYTMVSRRCSSPPKWGTWLWWSDFWRRVGKAVHVQLNEPISVYEMPIQSCGQSVSAPRGKAGVRLNAHTELRAKRQRSAREAIYRNRPIEARVESACFQALKLKSDNPLS